MTTNTEIKQQIYQLIETLPVERLPVLLRFLKSLASSEDLASPDQVAPVYQFHQHAVDTGISDLAANHGHSFTG
jgi:hypothetical protein